MAATADGRRDRPGPHPLFLVDRAEDPIPAGPQVRRPVSERLGWSRFGSEPADALPQRSHTSRIITKETRCQVQRRDLPVAALAHHTRIRDLPGVRAAIGPAG